MKKKKGSGECKDDRKSHHSFVRYFDMICTTFDFLTRREFFPILSLIPLLLTSHYLSVIVIDYEDDCST